MAAPSGLQLRITGVIRLCDHNVFGHVRTVGDYAFSCGGPSWLWNKLKNSIFALTNLNSFKRQIKTYLFNLQPLYYVIQYICNGRRRGVGAEPGRPLRRSVGYDAADGDTGFSLCLLCFTGDRIVLL